MHLLRFDSESAWASGVATFWRDRLRANSQLRICLPSGLTPAPIYAETVRSCRAGLTSFARARISTLDEFGGLAPDDPGRTRNTLLRQLIREVDLPPAAFCFFDPDAPDIERECERYHAAAGDRFDLVLLGLGRNGHLGMNEPGSPADSPTRRVDLHEDTIRASARYFGHPDLPRWGITVGMAPILASTEIWLLANGPTKAEIVQRTIHGDIGESVPASLLRRHANCSLFVDVDAGTLL